MNPPPMNPHAYSFPTHRTNRPLTVSHSDTLIKSDAHDNSHEIKAIIMSAAPSEFHALPLPVGVERRILYHSSYRAIATYGCSMSELMRP